MIEIKLLADKKIIGETLSRIGIANRIEKVLFPSCYLFEEDSIDYLMHFKEYFLLTNDDAFDNIVEDDIHRLNAIAYLLKKWGLIEVNADQIQPHDKKVFVLPYQEKREWRIEHKIKYRR